VTYLITFACYGCRLHGDAAGSADRWHNVSGASVVEEHLARATFEEERMDQPPCRGEEPGHKRWARHGSTASNVMSVFEAQEV
jgi:hypothetical protein